MEDAPAAKQEVLKREESGRDRVKPSTNPRFAPPVPLRRSAHLRVASDQEEENIPKMKEPVKAVNQDTKVNGDMHFSLKDLYFDNQMKETAGKGEVGTKEEAVSEAAPQPVSVSRQMEDASSSSNAAPAPSEGQKDQRTAQESEGHKVIGPEVIRTDRSQCGSIASLWLHLGSCCCGFAGLLQQKHLENSLPGLGVLIKELSFHL